MNSTILQELNKNTLKRKKELGFMVSILKFYEN